MVLICQNMDAISSWVDTFFVQSKLAIWRRCSLWQSLIWVWFSGRFMMERPHFQVGQWCVFLPMEHAQKNPSTCDPFQPPNLTSKTRPPNIGMGQAPRVMPNRWIRWIRFALMIGWWLKKLGLIRFARLVIFHKPSSPRIPQESLNQDTQPEKGPMKVEAGCHELQLSKCYLGEIYG